MRRPVGVKWVLLVFRWTRFFPVPSRYCRHPSIRTLSERLSLGASWAFSLQPVLPPVRRPLFHSEEWKLGQGFDAVTGTRRVSFWFFPFPGAFGFWFVLVFRPRQAPPANCANSLPSTSPSGNTPPTPEIRPFSFDSARAA